jgi:hypothetical protein
MNRNIVVRGSLSDPQHIELTEPVSGISAEVDVLIRALPKGSSEDVFDLIANLTPGTRSKADIDRQIHKERAASGD